MVVAVPDDTACVFRSGAMPQRVVRRGAGIMELVLLYAPVPAGLSYP